MQIVRIENTWDREIVIPHLGQQFVVPVGKSKIVPFEAAASIFGDPRARNDGKHRGRTELYDQVRGMWNFYLGFDNDQTWQDKCPQFRAFDVNSEDEIFFVIQDPDGTRTFSLTDNAATATTDSAILASAIEQLKAQVAQLSAALAVSKQDAVVTTDTVVPTPAPEVVPANTDAVVEAPIADAALELPKANPTHRPRRDNPRP